MYCTACGSQIPQDAAFCPSCGTKVSQPVTRRAPNPAGPVDRETATDLRAALEARRELGPEMEDQVLDSFLARLDERITTRIDEQVARRVPRDVGPRRGGLHNLPEPALVVGGSLALAIPLMGAGGDFAAVPVMVGVVLINLFYFLFRKPG